MTLLACGTFQNCCNILLVFFFTNLEQTCEVSRWCDVGNRNVILMSKIKLSSFLWMFKNSSMLWRTWNRKTIEFNIRGDFEDFFYVLWKVHCSILKFCWNGWRSQSSATSKTSKCVAESSEEVNCILRNWKTKLLLHKNSRRKCSREFFMATTGESFNIEFLSTLCYLSSYIIHTQHHNMNEQVLWGWNLWAKLNFNNQSIS